MKKPLPSSYIKVLNDIKSKARIAQTNAVRKVNSELISLYWNIGKTLDSKIKSEKWGSSVIDSLVKDLQKEFKGSLGFSKTNLYGSTVLLISFNSKLDVEIAQAKLKRDSEVP